MQWNWVTPVVVAVIGVGGSWLQVRRGRPHGRDLLKQDLEIFKALPAESQARQRLLEHIDEQVIHVITGDEKKRNPEGIASGFLFIIIGIGLLAWAIAKGDWWWWLLVPAVLTGALGIVGILQDAVGRKRDEQGRPI